MHVKYTHEYFYILTQNIHITFKIAIKFSQKNDDYIKKRSNLYYHIVCNNDTICLIHNSTT